MLLQICLWPTKVEARTFQSCRISCQSIPARQTNRATEQFAVCKIKCGQLLFEDSGGPQRSMGRGHHCMKTCKAIFDRNPVVRKNQPICMENP